MTLKLFLSVVFLLGQRDFDLADALDHPDDIITRKPTVIRRPTRPGLNNDLHLGDALDGGDVPRKPLYPPLPPRPGSYSNSGGFDDSDLLDGKSLPPYIAGQDEHNFNHGGNTDSGLVAGVTSPIISAFVILVVGSIAAYSAYKNKKLCFKPRGKTKLFPTFRSDLNAEVDGNVTISVGAEIGQG
ncbi:glycoprotein Xg [Indicator indicator]|uniref:glycoprotein Xg n=1 Tax=Indicator indicator TaxID=1002788 RepID=UPI0023DF7FC4|nr:glycoprotein Xg [Indicator indicator]